MNSDYKIDRIYMNYLSTNITTFTSNFKCSLIFPTVALCSSVNVYTPFYVNSSLFYVYIHIYVCVYIYVSSSFFRSNFGIQYHQ